MSRAADLRLLERTGALVAQLFFIAAGVYLGNRADAWKEERSHRGAARAALQNFRTELAANRDQVARKLPYHTALRDSLRAIQQRPLRSAAEFGRRTGFQGLQTIRFRHTAYDLAIATQAFSYVDPALGFAIASVYDQQARLQAITDPFLASAFNPVAIDVALRDPETLVHSMQLQMEDVATYSEPGLMQTYAQILPRLDSALAAAKR